MTPARRARPDHRRPRRDHVGDTSPHAGLAFATIPSCPLVTPRPRTSDPHRSAPGRYGQPHERPRRCDLAPDLGTPCVQYTLLRAPALLAAESLHAPDEHEEQRGRHSPRRRRTKAGGATRPQPRVTNCAQGNILCTGEPIAQKVTNRGYLLRKTSPCAQNVPPRTKCPRTPARRRTPVSRYRPG